MDKFYFTTGQFSISKEDTEFESQMLNFTRAFLRTVTLPYLIFSFIILLVFDGYTEYIHMNFLIVTSKCCIPILLIALIMYSVCDSKKKSSTNLKCEVMYEDDIDMLVIDHKKYFIRLNLADSLCNKNNYLVVHNTNDNTLTLEFNRINVEVNGDLKKVHLLLTITDNGVYKEMFIARDLPLAMVPKASMDTSYFIGDYI